MNKYLKTFLVFWLIAWSIGYISICYLDWTIYNPIQNILDLPIATPEERGSWFGLVFIVSFFMALFSGMYHDKGIRRLTDETN